MVKHVLACLCKGSPIYAWKTREIPSRDTNIAELIHSKAYAYFIFDTDINTDISNLAPNQILNVSPITYLGGTIYTLDEIRQMVKEQHVKISITPIPGTSIKQIPKMKQMIKTSASNWLPFFEGDILISINKE